MPAALLAIVVAAGEASTPVSSALLASAAESLAPAISVRMVESPEPGESQGLNIERQLGASAVVVVTWTDAARLHAQIQVHVAGSDRWTVRVLAFSGEDTLAQRGRMVGLAAASMCPPQTVIDAPSEEQPATKAPAATASESEVAMTGAPERRPEGRPAPLPGEIAATAPSPNDPVPRRRRLGVSCTAATGVGGPATGLGGAVEGVIAVANSIGLRLAGGLRAGSIAALPGTHFVASLAGGVEWWGPPAGRWSFVMRADALLLRHQVTRTAAGAEETLARFVPGADLVAALALRLSSSFEMLIGVGAELSFGATEIRDGTAHVVVATIPALRAIGQAGFRVGF